MEIITEWIIPILACIIVGVAGVGAFIKKNKGKSVLEIIDSLMEDETVCDLFSNILEDKTGQKFQTLEEYAQWVKEQFYAKFIIYLKDDLKFPSVVIDTLTIQVVSEIIDNLMDKYGINDLIEETFGSKTLIEEIEPEETIEVLNEVTLEEPEEEDLTDLGQF